MTEPVRGISAALAALALIACGGDPATPDGGAADADPGCPAPASARLLPLAIGASWTFAVTPSGGAPETKVTTVEALEDVGATKAGVIAFRIRTEKLDGITVSWQEDTCTSIVRHREQAFDLGGLLESDQVYVPSKLRVDESPAHTAQDATWIDAYTEVEEDPITGDVTTTSKSERWTVEDTAAEVTVPAGTFTALLLRRMGEEVGQADKRYWFVAGVGKVKEEGDQLEELTEYTLP
ncbi:MAG: hypothetical protein R2939_01275 [Kofleriaceae bacterium]